jgi:hypothetical protein
MLCISLCAVVHFFAPCSVDRDERRSRLEHHLKRLGHQAGVLCLISPAGRNIDLACSSLLLLHGQATNRQTATNKTYAHFSAMRLLPRPRLRQHPRRSLLVASLLLSLLYLTLWIVEKTKFGRWYWNYAAAIHPVLLYIMPPGKWGSIDRPPRWVQEIHDAPWMGEWELPELSPPLFERRGNDEAQQEQLTSPALIKLHVFSTAFPGARAKRDLIRRLSPMLNIPLPYRHLVELKFVLGHAEDGDGGVDEAVEALLAEEQNERGDLIRLRIAHGENMNEGKTLDWIRAVGTGQDGGKEAWWLFKVDDDVSGSSINAWAPRLRDKSDRAPWLVGSQADRPQCVLNIAKLLDTLLKLDHHQPHYLGTSLNRWPGYHHHFTGMSMGFSWGLVRACHLRTTCCARSPCPGQDAICRDRGDDTRGDRDDVG